MLRNMFLCVKIDRSASWWDHFYMWTVFWFFFGYLYHSKEISLWGCFQGQHQCIKSNGTTSHKRTNSLYIVNVYLDVNGRSAKDYGKNMVMEE